MNIPYTISGLRRIGLTQTQIGGAIGRKQTSVSDMEAGKAGVIRPTESVVRGLEKLAAKHGVPTAPPPAPPP
ncbi:hypothetical protein BN2497_2583 [Janthinobacterium sp. CG23_2]|nr:hypothetical protein BN2497_2583 [Janthinobacterium sp. CG23_2]CUU27689.1 hypothetical protein BN3177_2583 [Janthinobacterium sp. CG23_2]